MLSARARTLLKLSKLNGVGDVRLRKSLKYIGEGMGFHEISKELPQIGNALKVTNISDELIEAEIKRCIEHEVQIITIFDSNFPSAVKNDLAGPCILFIKGDISILDKKCLGIVGQRDADQKANIYAYRIGKHFAEEGVPILSGLARGCDTKAHEATLEVGGKAVGVLAHGLHMISPQENQLLAKKILDTGGVLVSQFPFGSAPSKFSFVQRDRTQASLSSALILVQSSLNGGSLHSCRASIEMGKTVFVMPPSNEKMKNANFYVHRGQSDEIQDLFKCDQSSLHQIVPLKTKDDYPRVIDNL